MKKLFVMIIILITITSLSGAYFELRRPPVEAVVVYIIDINFQGRRYGGANPSRTYANMRILPGHGQLIQEIIQESAGDSRIEFRLLEIEAAAAGLRREQFVNHLEHILFQEKVENNKHVLLNISLAFSTASEKEAELFQGLKQAGITTIAAAGNSGDKRLLYPAAYEDTLAVTSGSVNGLADYATYNDKVDLAAGGEVIRYLPGSISSFSLYQYRQAGSSFAAPRITGLFAGIISRTMGEAAVSDLLAFLDEEAPIITENIRLVPANKLLFSFNNLYYYRQLAARSLLILLFLLIFPSWQILKKKRIRSAFAQADTPQAYFALLGRNPNWKDEEAIPEEHKFSREFSYEQYLDYLTAELQQDTVDPEKLAKNINDYVEVYKKKLLTEGYSSLLERGQKEQFKFYQDSCMRFWLKLLQENASLEKQKNFALAQLEEAESSWSIYYLLVGLAEYRRNNILSGEEIEKVNLFIDSLEEERKLDALEQEGIRSWHKAEA